MMEQRLQSLFDYQRFENNDRLSAMLADALGTLDIRLRDIIILHYYGGKTLKEIATAMNMSYPNMKVLHKKALNQLKKMIA